MKLCSVLLRAAPPFINQGGAQGCASYERSHEKQDDYRIDTQNRGIPKDWLITLCIPPSIVVRAVPSSLRWTTRMTEHAKESSTALNEQPLQLRFD